MTKIIGAHVSASGGLDKTPKRAADIGCNAVQLFTSSPRTWAPADPDSIDYDAYHKQANDFGIVANVIHAIYLVNLASDKPELVEKSRKILHGDMAVAAKLGSVGVVVHVGSHQGRGYEAMKDQMVTEISRIIEETPEEAVFLIENSAGQKGKIGSSLEEVKDLIDAVGSPRLGWCYDTCHGHAAGYRHGILNLDEGTLTSNSKNLQSSVINHQSSVIDTIEKFGLLDSLKVIHLNDSRDPFDSGRDRHDNLGQGNIPEEDLKTFVNDPRIAGIPLILEVPGFDKKGPDEKNVSILKKMAR